MPRPSYLANAILWAAAIIVAAIMGAPESVTLFLLPLLAACALLVTSPKGSQASGCGLPDRRP